MVTMLSSCMDSITTEPPETTFNVTVCCLPLGSLASHWPASAFRLSNEVLAFGADKTGTEMAKNAIAIAIALNFICFLPRSLKRDARISWETKLPYLIYSLFFRDPLGTIVKDSELQHIVRTRKVLPSPVSVAQKNCGPILNETG